HRAWWRAYWAKADVRLPNPVVERQWALDLYKFGAAARRGAPPITLQAVWTADDGRIPPWKGDYHHDLNTQLSYWPCYAGNHLEEGLSYLDWLWATRDEAYAFTRNFFGAPGLNVPMTADLLGRQIGGWHQYTHSATTSAWLAHHFVLHWRYSGDEAFLRERAYPYLSEACRFLDAVLETDANGVRYLPLTSSPEIHDDRLEAWLTPTSNYDLALIRWAFATAAELAARLGRAADAERWSAALAGLPPFALADDGRLMVSPDEALAASHRHFSHLMAIHPLSLITWEQGEASRRTIAAALSELDRLGPAQWCGYSYAWLASLAARAKDGERAERALEIFAKAFCTANSFHVNGDQTKRGYSNFTYRPFTLEGNFAAAAGVHEMLLQSYGGVIQIFPSVPASWREVGFTSLRAEGGFLVSAERKGGRTVEVRVQAEVGGRLELVDPFAGAGRWRIEGAAAQVVVADGRVRAELPAGAVVSGRMKK
ncbi:MAG TPA: hypothetical protein VFK80_10220, partial [Limnochordia bacterium]|nr:hypothetical protein [Limnochordia bacterium]